jgi:hypothetical protein
MADEDDWFAPKRFGFGPGLPIAWQGWALMIGSVVVAVAAVLAFRQHPAQLVAILIPLTVAILVIGCRKTRGGCRWRSGKGE